MNDAIYIVYACTGVCIGMAGTAYWCFNRLVKYFESSIKTHTDLTDKLFDIRDTILKELSGKYKAELNSLTNRAYLDFLDRAYSSRFGDVNGWSFKIPPDVVGKDTIDLNLYFTDDEVTAIKKARAIYGIDSRFELFDKRLGL